MPKQRTRNFDREMLPCIKNGGRLHLLPNQAAGYALRAASSKT